MHSLRAHRRSENHRRPLHCRHVFSRQLPRGNLIPLPPRTDRRACGQVSGRWERSGADGVIVVVDIVAVIVDGAVAVDICSVVRIVAGGPQPPPAKENFCNQIPGSQPGRGCNLLLSLFIHPPSRFRHSVDCLEICSYCFGRMHLFSMAKSEI